MPKLIAVSGGTCAGKTSLCLSLSEALNRPSTILHFHDYYKDESQIPEAERALINYGSPESLDVTLFLEHLKTLKQGYPVEKPRFDLPSHTRLNVTEHFEPQDVILVEGSLTLLLPKECFDFCVYVEADDDTRLARRIHREVTERGHELETVLHEYFASLKANYQKYVVPSKNKADFVFLNNGKSGIDEEQSAARITHIDRL